ncbi:hypothetical protein TNCV_4790151 [Trichonephila clavipes]|nr:hypothetical protein TNCV_4790151 [Trichonephila clavipes]
MDHNSRDHRIFQRLHRKLRETRSFHVIRAVRSSSLKASISNVVAVGPESSTRAVDQHVSVSHETVCRVLKENRLHLFHFQRVPVLNPEVYLLRLPGGGTAM